MAAEGSTDFSRISNLWFSIRPILLIVGLVLVSLYTNEAIIAYRMEEYNSSMEALSQSYNSSHSLNMLARFELIKQRQSLPEEDETGVELRLQALNAGNLLASQERKVGLKSRLIGGVIGVVEFLLGKKKKKADVSPVVMHDLEVAYFYERSRKYDRAVEIYTKGLSDPRLSSDVSATLLLHRGFCHSLMGDYAQAIADFLQVSDLVRGTDEARVADKLIALTKGLEDQVRLAREAKQGPLQAGRQMFLLANYAEAAKNLRQVIASATADSAEKLESRYLFGRTQEEMGQDSDAVISYRTLIQQSPGSAFAKKANRRLYVLGKFYSNDEELAKAALKQIEKYQDFSFINNLKSLEVARPRDPLPASAVTEDIAAVKDHPAAKLDKLEAIDVGNLKGDKKSEPSPPAKTDAEKLSATLRKDGLARRANARILADPLRQEAIFSAIESNQGELEFIYQKFLRKGNAFEGSLTVRMLIAPAGTVKDAKIVSEKSTIDNAAFSAEILQNVKKWRFREDPHTDGDIPISFPVRFVNKQ